MGVNLYLKVSVIGAIGPYIYHTELNLKLQSFTEKNVQSLMHHNFATANHCVV